MTMTERDRQKTIKTLKANATVNAIVSLARSDERVAATIDQWDLDPWLLNTPDGVVDLKTGSIRPHSPQDYMTKMTAVAPGADCPQWRAFLNRIMAGRQELIDYLQRLAGYALTGSTREHVLPFAVGAGRNGKGTFIGALQGCMGDYAKSVSMEVFTLSKHSQHPTELAQLAGLRLVTAQETEEGRDWAENRIKMLTGGDRISARFMRQDFFEFDPQFTLLLAGNKKPGLRSVDVAIRERFHLIPFDVVIPAPERDPELPEKLRAEWPGILAWAIQGAVWWLRDGLAPPPVITEATRDYLDNQDALATWLSERTVQADQWAPLKELYRSYKFWCGENGEFALRRHKFSDELEQRGFTKQRLNFGYGFYGLNVLGAFPMKDGV